MLRAIEKPLKSFKQRKDIVHFTLQYHVSVHQYNLQWVKDLKKQNETMKMLGDMEQFFSNLEVRKGRPN